MGKKGGRKPDFMDTTFKGMHTALECQKKCQRESFCDAFVFNTVRNPPTCNLKTFDSDKDKLKTAKGKTFGLKNCPGNITIYICILKNTIVNFNTIRN